MVSSVLPTFGAQLALPFDRNAVTDERRVVVRDRFTLVATLDASGVTLQWLSDGRDEPLVALLLTLRPQLDARVVRSRFTDEEVDEHGLYFCSEPFVRDDGGEWWFEERGGRDAFGEFWAGLLWTARRLTSGLSVDELREAHSLLDACEAWALSQLPPRGRELARRFWEGARSWVLNELLGDATGRIAQALAVCPGLASVALHLRERNDADAWPTARGEIIAGRKLNRVIDRLVECTLPADCPRGSAVVRSGRQAVRRAGPWVKPDLVCGVFPQSICWDDVPNAPAENAVWFETVGVLCKMPIPGRSKASLAAFASAQAMALHRAIEGRFLSAYDFLEWCMLTDRVLRRRSDPAQLVGDAVAWWRAHRGDDGSTLAARAQLGLDGVAFPRPPFADWSDDRLTATAIRDASALSAHGLEMDHCVYDQHVERAVAGSDCIYDCSYEGERFTLAVRRQGDKWFFLDAKGVSNRPLTAAEREALDACLASRGIERGRCKADP